MLPEHLYMAQIPVTNYIEKQTGKYDPSKDGGGNTPGEQPPPTIEKSTT